MDQDIDEAQAEIEALPDQEQTEAAENEGMDLQGVDSEPTEETTADPNMAANDFSQKIYEIVKEYQASMPLLYMAKILNAIIFDLQAALLGTNIEYLAKQLREEFQEKIKDHSHERPLIG